MCPFTWFGCLTEEVVDPRLAAIDTDLNADRKSAVPLDLHHAMQNAEDDGSGLWLDIHPPTNWHDCPACGTRLYGQSLFHDGDDHPRCDVLLYQRRLSRSLGLGTSDRRTALSRRGSGR
jgi:hypothetical protein